MALYDKSILLAVAAAKTLFGTGLPREEFTYFFEYPNTELISASSLSWPMSSLTD